MRNVFILIFILISISLNAANHYVKTGGNDALSGADDANAWATIAKVNGETFSAGDSVLFKRGDKFIGTLIPPSSGTASNRIIFGSYGNGENPIITPNTNIPDVSWTVYSGNIYKTTDITFNPGNILVDGTKKINKINDNWFNTNPTDGRYGNLTSLGLMNNAENQTYIINYITTNFWDGLEALYCYDSATGTTYIRFRAGDNPNSKSLSIAAEESEAIYVYNKRFITIQNISIIGGEYGINLYWIAFTGTDNIIIEDCYIASSNQKIYIHHGDPSGFIIRNNTITNNYLSPYNPGAWVDGTEYIHGVNKHYYEFFKYRVGISQSSDGDQGIDLGVSTISNVLIYGNSFINCVNGFSVGGTNVEAYDNYIENASSEGIGLGSSSINSKVHDNYIINCNIPFRFQYVDETVRTNYIYRNKIFIPDAGELMYIHYGPTKGPSTTQAFCYHNSIICKTGMIVSAYANDNPPNGTGFIFINNIVSASGNNSGSYSWVGTTEWLWDYYYNWTGGTFYGAGALPGDIAAWATDASNLNNVGDTYWDHSIDPPDFEDTRGKGTIDAGIDISVPFTLGGVNYSALPGTFAYSGTPDIGYFEYEESIRRKVKKDGVKVKYGTKTVYY